MKRFTCVACALFVLAANLCLAAEEKKKPESFKMFVRTADRKAKDAPMEISGLFLEWTPVQISEDGKKGTIRFIIKKDGAPKHAADTEYKIIKGHLEDVPNNPSLLKFEKSSSVEVTFPHNTLLLKNGGRVYYAVEPCFVEPEGLVHRRGLWLDEKFLSKRERGVSEKRR